MKNLTKLQQEIHEWRLYNFPLSNEEDQFVGLVEEIGELAHVRLKIRQGIRNVDLNTERDAIGDILIYLFNYCSERQYDIEDILTDTWNVVKKRNWIKYPFNGVDK